MAGYRQKTTIISFSETASVITWLTTKSDLCS